MKRVYIALGSNLGLPQEQLQLAIEQLQQLPDSFDLHLSRWYRSAPVGGPADQPDYINAVCSLQTELAPLALLHLLQTIEHQAGRVREVRWGPRTLDLDIIWFQDIKSDDPELTLPHPRAHERAFVLRPLQDLDADFKLQGQTIEYWLNTVSEQQLHPL